MSIFFPFVDQQLQAQGNVFSHCPWAICAMALRHPCAVAMLSLAHATTSQLLSNLWQFQTAAEVLSDSHHFKHHGCHGCPTHLRHLDPGMVKSLGGGGPLMRRPGEAMKNCQSWPWKNRYSLTVLYNVMTRTFVYKSSTIHLSHPVGLEGRLLTPHCYYGTVVIIQ